MNTRRLESFSDGVMAILITIMVLRLKVPEGISFEILKPLLPVFLTYLISFIYLGIYWNNHHHLFHVVKQVNGKILWANLNLLFWLSLFPFVTGWMGENHFENYPTALYGLVLFIAALSYKLLVYLALKNEGKDSKVGHVYNDDKKMNISLVLYLSEVGISFFQPIISVVIYVFVALMWIIPEKRIEKSLGN
jgi:uncharacterized membrane protein